MNARPEIGNEGMDVSRIKDIVRDVLAEELDLDRSLVVDGLSCDDSAAWDSTKHVEIVFTLEDRFGVEFDLSEIEDMYSFEGILKALESKT